jgi:hypothetical protein
MIRMILAAAVAFALVSAAPAFAACPDCKDCPMNKVAAADKAEKKDGEKAAVACPCAGEGKECKCGAQCMCPHCSAKKAEKKDEGKKS